VSAAMPGVVVSVLSSPCLASDDASSLALRSLVPF